MSQTEAEAEAEAKDNSGLWVYGGVLTLWVILFAIRSTSYFSKRWNLMEGVAFVLVAVTVVFKIMYMWDTLVNVDDSPYTKLYPFVVILQALCLFMSYVTVGYYYWAQGYLTSGGPLVWGKIPWGYIQIILIFGSGLSIWEVCRDIYKGKHLLSGHSENKKFKLVRTKVEHTIVMCVALFSFIVYIMRSGVTRQYITASAGDAKKKEPPSNKANKKSVMERFNDLRNGAKKRSELKVKALALVPEGGDTAEIEKIFNDKGKWFGMDTEAHPNAMIKEYLDTFPKTGENGGATNMVNYFTLDASTQQEMINTAKATARINAAKKLTEGFTEGAQKNAASNTEGTKEAAVSTQKGAEDLKNYIRTLDEEGACA